MYQRSTFQKHIDVLFVLNWLVIAKFMLVTLEKSQQYNSSSCFILFEVVQLQIRQRTTSVSVT